MLSLLFPPRQRATTTADLIDYGPAWSNFGSRTSVQTKAGVTVSEETALTYAACWCATRVIVEAAGMLSLFLYERMINDNRREAVDHPLFDLLKTAPNPDMTSMPWREAMTVDQVNSGNGFSEIERENLLDPRSPIVALWPINACRVFPVTDMDTAQDGSSLYAAGFRYKVRNDDGSWVVLRASEMLHVAGALTSDGIWGKGVIQYARESIGYGLAVEGHGASYFKNGAQPPGIVAGVGLRRPEERKNFRAEWKEIHVGGSAEIAMLPDGATYTPIAVSNEDSQFLGSQAWGVQNIARWYKVPAYMLADPSGVGVKASVEQAGIEFVIYTVMPWLVRWEQQIDLKLLAPEERRKYYAEHLVAKLQQGDLKGRIDAYRLALMSGQMSLNDVNRLENRNSIGPAGDVRYLPVNLTTADRILTGDVVPAPGPGSDMSGAPNDGLDATNESAVGKHLAPAGRQEAPAENIQAASLNGAQIASLVLVADKLALGQYSKEAARSMIEASFPGISKDLVNTIVTELDSFEPAPVPNAAATAPAASQPSAAGHAATRLMLTDAIRRWRTKEANAAARKAKRPDFPTWLAEFHDSERATAEDMFTPAAAALSAYGPAMLASNLVASLFAISATELATAFETDTAPQFAARLDGWANQASAIADKFMAAIPAPAVQSATPIGAVEDRLDQLAALLKDQQRQQASVPKTRKRYTYNADGLIETIEDAA